MHRFRIAASQVLSLGFVLGSLYRGVLSPRILSFAFILVTAARLLTVHFMGKLGRWGAGGLVRFLQSSCFRPPPPGVPPPYYRDANTGQPVGPAAYLWIMALVMALAFVFLHLDSRHHIDFSWSVFSVEMTQAGYLALIYWLSDLFARDIIFDARRPDIDNLAYNDGSLTILVVAIVFCAGLIAFVESRGYPPLPWVFYGPVLALVHLTALWRGLRSVPDG